MQETYHILRNASLNGTDLEDLRVAVGWDRMEGLYEAILKKSYSHFSVTVADKLIAFVNVIRDGIRCIEVIFDPRLDRFYRRFGFHIVSAGIIDRWDPNE